MQQTYITFTEEVPLVAALAVVLLLPGFDDIIEDDCGEYIDIKSNLNVHSVDTKNRKIFDSN